MTDPRNQRKRETEVFFELAIIFSFLVSLGFPGNLTNVMGESMEKLLEYGAFFLELLLLMFSSSDSWQDIELIHLNRKYWAMYLYVFSCFGISMLVTYDMKAQAITCVRLVVTLLFVIWLQERYSIRELLEMLCIAQGALVLFTLLFMVIFRSQAYSNMEDQNHALIGLFETKNACATELVFGIVVTVLLLREKQGSRRRELHWWVLLLIQIVLLLMCQAMGANITALLAVLSIFVFPNQRLPLGLVYISANVVFLFCMLALMPYFENMLVAMGKDATLTGRIPIWRRVIEVMTANRTMTGFGYGMFWRDPTALLKFQTGFSMRKDPFMATLTTGAHNVIMEAWLNSGLLGLAALFFMTIFSFRDMNSLRDDQYRLCIGIMTFLTINGLTERCLGGNFDYRIMSCFLAMAVGCNAAGSRRRTLVTVRNTARPPKKQAENAF